MTAVDERDDLVRAAVVADVMRMGEARYWRRRAEQFEWAKPAMEGDFPGESSLDDLRAAWRRCHAAAEACRNKARLLELEATW